MLLEPPGQDIPARHGLTAALPVGRGSAALAAVVLAVLSRGDAITLAVALAVVAWRPLPAVGLTGALLATGWRFGSTSLEAIAGAQAVLGPAGVVGPGRAAAASLVAAVAVVLACPREVGGTEPPIRWSGAPEPAVEPPPSDVGGTRPPDSGFGAPNLLATVAFGATAALVVAGPAPGGDLWVRAVAGIVASVAAFFVSRLLPTRVREIAAALCGAGALGLLAGVAPGWSGTLDPDALHAGLALVVAVGALWAVGASAAGALGRQGD